MLQGLRTHINIVKDMGTRVYMQIIVSKEDVVRNAEDIGEAAVEAMSIGI